MGFSKCKVGPSLRSYLSNNDCKLLSVAFFLFLISLQPNGKALLNAALLFLLGAKHIRQSGGHGREVLCRLCDHHLQQDRAQRAMTGHV